jgi:Asp-tRNA(Asn)/Glu-tRNA(Gln) amidotransferase A subunit family amidase
VSDGSAQGIAIDRRCADALAETSQLLEQLGHEVDAASPDYAVQDTLEAVTTLLCVALAEELPGVARLADRPIGLDTVERCHLELMRRGERLSALELSRALALRGELGRVLGRFFDRHDVLLTPALAEPPIRLGELNTDASDTDAYLARLWRYAPFTPLANLSGTPSMSVPLHWSGEGWPIGTMFTAAYGAEETLFSLAAQLEQERPWSGRHPPLSAWTLPGTND